MVFGAHNDDAIIGAGGTVAKYSDEGKKVVVVVFSYGVSSHPHLKPEVITDIRVKECRRSDKILGIRETFFLGLKEGHFKDEILEKQITARLVHLIRKYKPIKIFTHSMDDPHPDHRAVHLIITSIIDKIKYKGDVYSYDIWNPVNLKKRTTPKLVVDISETFKKKTEAFKAHKSQQMTILTLMWKVYWQAILNGITNRCKKAEVFYKIK